MRRSRLGQKGSFPILRIYPKYRISKAGLLANGTRTHLLNLNSVSLWPDFGEGARRSGRRRTHHLRNTRCNRRAACGLCMLMRRGRTAESWKPSNMRWHIRPDQADIRVESCGLCHSDLSMLENERGTSAYPLVLGHEVIGIVDALGEEVKNLRVGQRVGLGWLSGSCAHCRICLQWAQPLRDTEQTLVGRHGGFAGRVPCSAQWAIPLPGNLDIKKAGPLFAAESRFLIPSANSAFCPHIRRDVGIGGLGCMASQFWNK